jgi:hypothetical protein
VFCERRSKRRATTADVLVACVAGKRDGTRPGDELQESVWCSLVRRGHRHDASASCGLASSQAEDAASEIAANNDQFTQWLQAMAETSDSDNEATDSSNDNNFSNLAASSGHARTDNKAHKRSKHSARSSGSHSSKGSKTKENYDSIGVLPPPTGKPVKITVSKHGKGDYKTINEALDSIKPNANHRTIIKIKAGVYKYVITSSKLAQLARSALTLLLLAAISSWFVQFDMSVSST